MSDDYVRPPVEWKGRVTLSRQGYRYGKIGRKWTADRWCDCILGPHWHDTGIIAPSFYMLCNVLHAQIDSSGAES